MTKDDTVMVVDANRNGVSEPRHGLYFSNLHILYNCRMSRTI